MSNRVLTKRFGLLVLSALMLVGCSANGLESPVKGLARIDDEPPVATRENPAVRMACLWQPGEGTGLDGKPTRGFAGQMFFFAAGSDAPVKVDGAVRVYEFDDQGSREEQVKAIHQFDFPPEVWSLYQRDSQWGPSYQVFIPYVRKGSHAADCALRVRLTAEGQQPVFSEMLTVELSGTKGPAPGTQAARQDVAATEADQFPDKTTRSETIRDSKGQVALEQRIDARLKRWKQERIAKTNTSAKGETNSDIQLVSALEPAEVDDRDARIRQLELENELLRGARRLPEPQTRPASAPQAARIPRRASVRHPLLEEESSAGLSGSHEQTNSTAESAGHPLQGNHEQSRPEGGTRHPLLDEGDDTVHPLADF